MPESLADLEQQRRAILQRIKPNCHCHQPNQPHGPNFRLPRKVKGKTVTHSFATAAEPHKAQREVATYQQFRELSQELLALNEKICRARPVVEEELTPTKKTTELHFPGPIQIERYHARRHL
jgi:hypothetical protein